MRLREFPFLADENVHPEVVAYLRAQDFDVLDVKEAGMAGDVTQRSFAPQPRLAGWF